MAEKQPNVLEDARDLTVVAHPQEDTYIYAVKPSLEFMKWAFDQTLSDPEERDVSVFNAHWQFNKAKGIIGSSTYLDLRFDKKALRPLGLWVPGWLEARTLDNKGKLENGVYRDVGVGVLTAGEPNKHVAQPLSEAGFGLPLIVPFRALDYAVSPEKGVNVFFTNNPQGVISGSRATEQINAADYKGNSGALRLGRHSDGGWSADWGLPDSGAYGRVGDWICGEATREILEQAHGALSEKNYGEKIRSLRTEQEAEQARFEEALSSLNNF